MLALSWKEKSLEGLMLLSEEGDPEAQYYLAEHYEEIFEDNDLAESWRKKSFNGSYKERNWEMHILRAGCHIFIVQAFG